MTKEPRLRDIALDALLEIVEKGQYSHKILHLMNEKYAYLKKEDRAFISRLVHGSLEYLLLLDAVIARYSKIEPAKLKPVVRNVLRLSVYQIMYMDKVPDAAACNEAVKLVEKRGLSGLKGFTNGVLRSIIRDKDKLVFTEESLRYALPQWIADLIRETAADRGEEEVQKVFASFLEEEELSLRVNTRKKSPEALLEELRAAGMEGRISDLHEEVLKIRGFDRISDLDCLHKKEAYIQDASSALAVKALGITKGSTVLDVCAAPGGKSIYALEFLQGEGKLYAFDLHPSKLRLLEENLRRYTDAGNVELRQADASLFHEEYAEKADFIIADLPCSGLGILGKKADIKLHITKKACMDLADVQLAILNNVKKYLKKGGKLLYSTCTISRYENQDNVKRFLEQNPEFSLCDFGALLPEALREEVRKGYLQLLPGIHDGDGFFISILKKEDDGRY